MKSPPAGRLAGLFRAVLAVVFWMSGFGLTAWLAGVCLPPAELPPVVREKLTHLARHGDEYDAIFLGSSRVQYHIMPVVFERFAAEHGLAVKTFNAGVAAMAPPEDGYVLDEILRRPHRRLRWVFIELSAFSSGQNLLGTERIAYWHDWERLILVSKRAVNKFREVQFSGAKLRRTPWADRMAAYTQPITQWLDDVRLFTVKSLSLGRGATAGASIVTPVAPNPAGAGESLGRYGDGWEYAGEDHQRMSGDMLARYETAYAERLETPSRKDSHDELSHEALEIIIARIVHAGARPILFVPPTPTKRHYFPPPERAPALTIFDFSDVREYPELFKTENRQDLEHLNGAGAEVFSRILARRFVEHVRSGP